MKDTNREFRIDAIGNKVYIGDIVAFATLNYRGMQKAKVFGFTKKGVRIIGKHYLSDREDTEFNRLMSQVVKVEVEHNDG